MSQLRSYAALLLFIGGALSACGGDDREDDGDMGNRMSMAGAEPNGSGSAGAPGSGD
jgi:hypothetical protein